MTTKYKIRNVQILSYMLALVVSVIAIFVWGNSYSWDISSNYQLFPLFGLLAFSLMWSHYIVGTVRQHLRVDKEVLRLYFDITSLLVLVAILLHPGLLAWQLWRDGQGLPPASEINYVASGAKGAVIIGIISWTIFLAYEFRRKFSDRRWWKYFQYFSDVAMILIFLHGLRLGGQLQIGWFRSLWIFYGLSLAVVLVYKYARKDVLLEKKQKT